MQIKEGEPFFYKASEDKIGQKFILDKSEPLKYHHMRFFYDKINAILESKGYGRLSREVWNEIHMYLLYQGLYNIAYII